jgi:phage recombination protein Bet
MADDQQLPATINRRKSVTETIAARYNMDAGPFEQTVRSTCMPSNVPVTKEQFAAFLLVANEHRLNPLTKEIFAFPAKHGGVIPVVSVDGWARIINENPALNGIEFKYSDQIVTMPGAKPCPEWCEVILYRKDRQHPTVVREYLDEVYREATKGPGPWQTHTKRFLRHKTLIQGSRIAFGFAGIYDEDEAHRIIEAEATVVEAEPGVIEMNSSQAKRGGFDKWITDTLLGATTRADIDAMFEDIRWKCMPPSWIVNYQDMIDFHKARVTKPVVTAKDIIDVMIDGAETEDELLSTRECDSWDQLSEEQRQDANERITERAMEIAGG